MIPFFKHAKVDVCCMGNHDLDFGKILFNFLAKDSGATWLLSNVFEENSDIPLWGVEDFVVLDHEGVRVGLIGLAEEEWLGCIVHINEGEYEFEDFVKCAKRWERVLREEKNCDLVVALTHMRMP